MLPQNFIIYIKDNNLVEIEKINEDKYNYFATIFDYVYHTKNGDTYPLDKDLERGIDILVTNGEHFHELLDDLKDQGFCDFESEET